MNVEDWQNGINLFTMDNFPNLFPLVPWFDSKHHLRCFYFWGLARKLTWYVCVAIILQSLLCGCSTFIARMVYECHLDPRAQLGVRLQGREGLGRYLNGKQGTVWRRISDSGGHIWVESGHLVLCLAQLMSSLWENTCLYVILIFASFKTNEQTNKQTNKSSYYNPDTEARDKKGQSCLFYWQPTFPEKRHPMKMKGSWFIFLSFIRNRVNQFLLLHTSTSILDRCSKLNLVWLIPSRW